MKTKISLLFFIIISLIASNNAFGSVSDSSGFFPLILNWKQTEIRTYNSANLYTPIDGAADLFLRYNFEEMFSTEYHCDTNYITIEVYKHKTPIDAFGIYSQEKPDRDIYVNIGVQGYKEDDYLIFFAGCYYVKMRVWKVNRNSQAAMLEIALKIAAKLNNNSIYPKIFSTFPLEGKIAFTDKYISRDVLGYNFLHSSFQADYSTETGKKFTIFAIKGTSEKDALEMLTFYFKFLKQPTNDLSDGLYQVYDPHNGLITILKSGLYLLCVRGDNTMENSIRELNEMKVKIDLLKE